jgi:hypothetical protein
MMVVVVVVLNLNYSGVLDRLERRVEATNEVILYLAVMQEMKKDSKDVVFEDDDKTIVVKQGRCGYLNKCEPRF